MLGLIALIVILGGIAMVFGESESLFANMISMFIGFVMVVFFVCLGIGILSML